MVNDKTKTKKHSNRGTVQKARRRAKKERLKKKRKAEIKALYI